VYWNTLCSLRRFYLTHGHENPIEQRSKWVMTECTANWTQVILSTLTFLVFVGLAIMTYRYARDTKRMADIMSKEFELRYRPFADVRVGIPWLLDDYSGFNIPLEIVLLGEFPFNLTRLALEIYLGKEDILKAEIEIDKTLTKQNPTLKNCVGPFADERILRYMEKRMKDSSIEEPQLTGLYIYHKNIEGKEELFQRLPVPYRNYYELDKICEKGSDIISTFGRSIRAELEEF
jgi:hypothetical protein